MIILALIFIALCFGYILGHTVGYGTGQDKILDIYEEQSEIGETQFVDGGFKEKFNRAEKVDDLII